MAWGSRRDAEFTAFVADASPSLGRTAWLLTGDPDAAAELLQATLVKTYVAWPRVRQGEAAAYARRIMVNTSIDAWRRRRDTTGLPGPEPGHPSQEDVFDERERLGRLLAALPLQQRKVIVLRFLHDLSEKAVAAELGLPLGTVKSSTARGLAALRSVLVEKGNP
ncbi:MAG TPA: SigE family RNA polymerase sigma factor [Propionicimonas sp.]|jgi:RNA polymerase sigma-70 factor (sigma-E family)|uniref:SigE family RNA polymerase sigma factor n=1 Tax=Propionicimonas sp. TaxID=1955623 RepID=UPI002F401E1B